MRPRPILLIAVLAAGWTLLGTGGRAQEEECVECHDEAVSGSSIHDGFGCADCHGELLEEDHPDSTLMGDAICSECHDAGQAVAASAHRADGVTCLSCHGEGHGILALSDVGSPMSPARQVAVCGACHEQGSLIDGYLISIHGRALLRAGLLGAAPSCSSCHGSHDILPLTDPAASVSREQVPSTCGSCHETILATWVEKSAHGIGWQAGNPEVPVCTSCHASHQIVQVHLPEARLSAPETCGGCHAGRFSTFRDSFHGKVTDLGFLTAAICSDCHTPHENLSAGEPDSSVHPSRLQATCGACHGEVSPRFVTFDAHSDPADPASGSGGRQVHAVWLFMTGLLIAVFGFFGVHDLLWLQRSLVGLLRGEYRRQGSPGGTYIRRFSPFQIRMHVVVVVTFLVLAATGLPLKYHDLAWAQAPMTLLGGVAAARFWHRVAALLTFGYFFLHLGAVLKRSLLEKERGLLWGWKSMVPRQQDFADLWANLKYFLYLGRRPSFDRWTYWEKFDYFAVFWGVAIIGCSGLMLWFPVLVTQWLPGWTLNAALVVHSDEALLAVGFIFVFHFFHTHLRPESFPMDPVIFTGRMSLERFKEEKSVEYRRLVESGELDGRLVEAPSAQELRRAVGWGLLAVTIGLLLIAGVLWGVLFH